MIELVAIEKIALSAVELPMLIRQIRIVRTRETRSALIGMSYASFAGARNAENGTPWFRANAQS